MKTLRLFSILLMGLLIQLSVMAQTTFVVNNNPGAPAGTNVHTNFAAAMAAATAGDIIYIVPSEVSYGDITVSDEVTIFGAGMEPDKDLPAKSYVNQVNITASNVRISGIITSSSDYWYIGNGTSSTTYTNITIENCRFRAIRHTVSSNSLGNVLIRNNVINSYYHPVDFTAPTSVNTITVTNNLINMYSNGYGLNAYGVNFTHNIFRYDGLDGNDGNAFNDVDMCRFEFNIFYGVTPNISNANNTNNTVDHNVSFGCNANAFTGLGSNGNSGANNAENADPDFVNLPLGNGWNGSYDITLGGGADASVLDIDGSGTTAGVTGGATPWDPDGSLLPTVQSISIPSVIPVGSDLDVNVTGKGN